MVYKIQKGAALLAVLVVAVIMIVLLAVASRTLQSRLVVAEQSKQKMQDSALVYAKINELSYLIATQRVTLAGVSQGLNPRGLLKDNENRWLYAVVGDEIRADGFTYQQGNGLEYSVQNTAGLIPVNSSGQYWLKRWLQGYGNSVIQQAKYADILADYADADNWRRPGGAEIAEYKKAEMGSTPANFLLQSCNELWRLPGWRELLINNTAMLQQCSLRRSDRLNINAVPINLWQLLWPATANNIAQQRAKGLWLFTYADIIAAEPSLLLLNEQKISPVAGKVFKLQVKKGAALYSTLIELGVSQLTPVTFKSTSR